MREQNDGRTAGSSTAVDGGAPRADGGSWVRVEEGGRRRLVVHGAVLLELFVQVLAAAFGGFVAVGAKFTPEAWGIGFVAGRHGGW